MKNEDSKRKDIEFKNEILCTYIIVYFYYEFILFMSNKNTPVLNNLL